MPASVSLPELTVTEKEFMLQLARESISQYPEAIEIKKIPENLKQERGVFVSLYVNNNLRGCVGHIFAFQPLYKAVMECAVSAAFQDNRFDSIKKEEIKKMRIEISLLTSPKKLEYSNPGELLNKIDKTKGVILKKGPNLATFLPQVWEQLPDKKEFMNNLCSKAMLPEHAWEGKDIEIFTYSVEKIEG